MGRFYSGDIEGKFWFGVQSSTDGEFFGAEEEDAGHINYTIPRENQEAVSEGVESCLKELGDWKERLDIFFKQTQGYNEQIAIDFWRDVFEIELNIEDFNNMLTWYARLQLGMKIEGFFTNNPGSDCDFQAEL